MKKFPSAADKCVCTMRKMDILRLFAGKRKEDSVHNFVHLGKQYLRTQKQEDAKCDMFDLSAWR